MIIRRLASLAGAAVVVLLSAPAAPVFAHGATTDPISRTAACAGGGSQLDSAACRAARSANGVAFGSFDDVRVPNVNGDDRQFVPDGQLCSGGLPQFHGLDLPRDDFPATTVTAGEKLTIKYRTTIVHRGTFRIYLTKSSYQATKALGWADLGSKPLAAVTNPSVSDGAFVMSAQLPRYHAGRQLLYIVWQTSNTPDTYYSCSDLVFAPVASPAPPSSAPVVHKPSPEPTPATTSADPVSSSAAAEAEQTDSPTDSPTGEPSAQALTPVGNQSRVTLGHQIIVAALVIAAAGTGWAVIGWLRRKRPEIR